jgi:hypothetical protein
MGKLRGVPGKAVAERLGDVAIEATGMVPAQQQAAHDNGAIKAIMTP